MCPFVSLALSGDRAELGEVIDALDLTVSFARWRKDEEAAYMFVERKKGGSSSDLNTHANSSLFAFYAIRARRHNSSAENNNKIFNSKMMCVFFF